MIAVDSELYAWQLAVSELFEERPIWPKDALTERLLVRNLKFTIQTLRRLLVAVAYYFIGGPFMRFWIRKGYDPRKDPDSCIYQRIDFRVPPTLRSYSNDSATDCLRHKWEDLCKFQVFPYKFQTTLQLYELDDGYIQEEIKKPPKQTTCTNGTGWFSQQVHDSFRFRVMMRFLSVCPKPGAAKLLKAASEDFEKSKRASMNKSSLRPAEEHQKIDEEVTVDEANENGNDIDEGEADDFEADDPEDELDAYEALDLAGEDDEASLQSHSYMENNSRSYLQDLFDGFPSPDGEGDGKTQDSDGEYQIYEQDDDEDYPDDNDD
ncbi:Transcription factor IIIC subunit 5 [Euphorbia peplus]|nr:Transcription factor IIIC subunit 5 [Euphorbia peplus]